MEVKLNSEVVDSVDSVEEGMELMQQIVDSIKAANPDDAFEVEVKTREILMRVDGEVWFQLEIY